MEAARVVEVHGGAYGTGYLVAGRLVLTARHILTEPERIRVRFVHHDDHHDGTLVWESADLDAALVEIVGTGRGARDRPEWPHVGRVRWGRLIGTRAGIPWQLAGFPRAQRLADRRRGLEVLRGELDPLVGAPHTLQLEMAPAGPADPARWQGVSGAAVTCNGLVTALVTDSMSAYQHRRLAALPVERLFAGAEFRRAVATACGCEPVLEAVELAPVAELAPDRATGRSPASLLRADAGAIAFHSRARELRRLIDWCDTAGVAARLLTGPAGYGKTRLAHELAATLHRRGWATGNLVADVDLTPLLDGLSGFRVPTLLVVDYAESRTNQLDDLVAAAMRHGGPQPLRLLLLARTGGDWWQQLAVEAARDRRDVLSATPVDVMGPIPLHDREELFANAVRGLAHHIGGTLPESVQTPDLVAGRFGSPLRIAMEALTVLLTATRPLRSASVEDVIVDHERPYWSAAAKAWGLKLEPEDQRTAVAAAALCGAANVTEALDLLRRLPGLGDDTDAGHRRRRRAARWLRDLYPAPTAEPDPGTEPDAGTDPDSDARRPTTYWGSLQPDLLAEHLVATVAREDADFLGQVLVEPSDAQARQALLVLSRAALHQPDASARLRDLIGGRADLARQAIAVVPQAENPGPLLAALTAVVDGIPLEVESLDVLWALAHALPTAGRRLDELGFRIYRAISEIHIATGALETATDQESFAAAAANLADQLSKQGRHHEAVQGLQLAVVHYEWFARQDPDRFRPLLTQVLADLAEQLTLIDQRDNARTTIDRALSLAESLAEGDPAAWGHLLASTLTTFAGVFPKSRNDESLAAIRRAVAIHEERAAADPGARPALAAVLKIDAVLSTAGGRPDEALTAAGRAVEIYEQLVAENPEAYRSDLAEAQYNLAAMLGHGGRFEEALETAESMAPTWVELLRSDIAGFGRHFVNAMAQLGFLRLEGGQPATAATAFAAVLGVADTVRLEESDTAVLQVARLLRTAYSEAPREVAEEWERATGRPLPDWLSDDSSDLVDDEAAWYRQLADAGDANAVRHLASLYERTNDLTEAERWRRRAAEAGDIRSMVRLGSLLRRLDRLDDAEPWWRRAAEAGDTEAMTDLAMLLMIRGDRAEPMVWARQAADFGNVRAMTVLATGLLAQGEPDEAEAWLRKAAHAGDTRAASNLLGLLEIKGKIGKDQLREASVSWRIG